MRNSTGTNIRIRLMLRTRIPYVYVRTHYAQQRRAHVTYSHARARVYRGLENLAPGKDAWWLRKKTICCIYFSNCVVYYPFLWPGRESSWRTCLPHYPTRCHNHMSLLINVSPSLHSLATETPNDPTPFHCTPPRKVMYHRTNPRTEKNKRT